MVLYAIEELKKKGYWQSKPVAKRTYNLFLADRGRIKYSKLTVGRKRKIITNFLRGMKEICNKARLARNLKEYCEDIKNRRANSNDDSDDRSIDYRELMPESYIIRSRQLKKNDDDNDEAEQEHNLEGGGQSTIISNDDDDNPNGANDNKDRKEEMKKEHDGDHDGEETNVKKENKEALQPPASRKQQKNDDIGDDDDKLPSKKKNTKKKKVKPDERKAFMEAFEQRQRSSSSSSSSSNAWIAKSTLGFKGKDIKVSNKANDLLDFIDNLEGVWVIQKYIENPMLVEGRKFDIRTWHVVTAYSDTKLKVYTYDEGVLRVSSKRYQNANFDDDIMHITNNAIQQDHQDYGKSERDNLLDFRQFDEILKKKRFPDGKRLTVANHVLPEINKIVITTLRSISDWLLPQPCQAYQILGYDFVITEDGNVRLLEVNLTPGTSNDLVAKMVADMVALTIDSEFPDPNNNAADSQNNGTSCDKSMQRDETNNGFQYVGEISTN